MSNQLKKAIAEHFVQTQHKESDLPGAAWNNNVDLVKAIFAQYPNCNVNILNERSMLFQILEMFDNFFSNNVYFGNVRHFFTTLHFIFFFLISLWFLLSLSLSLS